MTAKQYGTVAVEEAPVHQLPNKTSPVIGSFLVGERVPISDEVVSDVFGDSWYKTALTREGDHPEYGFVLSKHVKSDSQIEAQKASGIQRSAPVARKELDPVWNTVVRAMGIGGYSPNLTATLKLGGEIDITFGGLWGKSSYDRRRLGLGGGIQWISGHLIPMAVVVYRLFTHVRTEPEMRLRLGYGFDVFNPELPAHGFTTGISLGLRYPFTDYPGPHLGGHTEIGYTGVVASLPTHYLWVALGLGWYF